MWLRIATKSVFMLFPTSNTKQHRKKKKNKSRNPETQLYIKTHVGKNILQSYVEQVSAEGSTQWLTGCGCEGKISVLPKPRSVSPLEHVWWTLRLSVDRQPSGAYHKWIQHAIFYHNFEWPLSLQRHKVLHYQYLWVIWDHATDSTSVATSVQLLVAVGTDTNSSSRVSKAVFWCMFVIQRPVTLGKLVYKYMTTRSPLILLYIFIMTFRPGSQSTFPWEWDGINISEVL